MNAFNTQFSKSYYDKIASQVDNENSRLQKEIDSLQTEKRQVESDTDAGNRTISNSQRSAKERLQNDAESAKSRYTEDAEEEARRIKNEYNINKDRLEEEFDNNRREFNQMVNRSVILMPPYNPNNMATEVLPTEDTIFEQQRGRLFLPALPVGLYQPQRDSKEWLPYYIPWQSEDINAISNIFISYDDRQSQMAAFSLQNALMIRMLAAFPAGKLHFTVINPKSNAGFNWMHSHLAETREIYHNQQLSDQREIENRLKELKSMHQQRLERFTSAKSNSVWYNRHKEKIEMEYEVVLVYDMFSSDFRNSDLLAIIENGNTSGIYVIALQSMDMPNKYSRESAEEVVSKYFQKITCEGNNCLYENTKDNIVGECVNLAMIDEDARLRHLVDVFNVNEDSRVLKKYFNKLSTQVTTNTQMETTRKKLSRIIPYEQWLGTPYNDKKIDFAIPIGQTEIGDNVVEMNYESKGDKIHSMILGGTGSGKSVLLQDLIIGGAANYSPNKLQFYLVDFKDGVTFEQYAPLPHVRWMIANADKAVVYAMLKELQNEIRRRNSLFKKEQVNQLSAYNDSVSQEQKLPDIIVMFDEFQNFYKKLRGEKDELCRNMRDTMISLAKESRSAGIHLVMATQATSGEMEGLLLQAGPNSYILRNSDPNDVRQLLGQEAAEAAKELRGMAEQTAVRMNDKAAEYVPLYLPYKAVEHDENESAEEEIRRKRQEKCDSQLFVSTIVKSLTDKVAKTLFYGSDADMRSAYPLCKSLNFQATYDNYPDVCNDMELGVDLIGSHIITAEGFEELGPKKNLIIFGQHEDLTMRLVLASMRSLHTRLGKHGEKQCTYVINPWENYKDFPDLNDKYNSGFAQRQGDDITILTSIQQMVMERRAEQKNGLRNFAPVYLYILGYSSLINDLSQSVPAALSQGHTNGSLHLDDIEPLRLKTTLPDEDDQPTYMSMLKDILEKGSVVGVHVILQVESDEDIQPETVNNYFRYELIQHFEPNKFDRFDNRQMPYASESLRVTDSATDYQLKARVIYYDKLRKASDEDNDQTVDKFDLVVPFQLTK